MTCGDFCAFTVMQVMQVYAVSFRFLLFAAASRARLASPHPPQFRSASSAPIRGTPPQPFATFATFCSLPLPLCLFFAGSAASVAKNSGLSCQNLQAFPHYRFRLNRQSAQTPGQPANNSRPPLLTRYRPALCIFRHLAKNARTLPFPLGEGRGEGASAAKDRRGRRG